MKKIIYSRPDGRLCVIHPNINTIAESNGITPQAALERAKKDIPRDAINPRVVDESAIPADRTFRNAWIDTGNEVAHDIAKCRDLYRQILRDLRAPKLKALDVEFMRAAERGDTTAISDISVRKQLLRDAPQDPRIDAAVTIEELKAVIPESLG